MKISTFSFLAKKLLKNLNILTPTNDQVSKMEDLLANSCVQSRILFDNKLTSQEKVCLLLAAQGKTAQQTADLLNISKETVESHRKEIRRKLDSHSMAHAVYQGIRYGFIKDNVTKTPISGECFD